MGSRTGLDVEALAKDLEGAAARLGVRLEATEEREASDGGRVTVTHTLRVVLPEGASAVRARFVRQGWAERAKKIFVDEIEVGEPRFDDAVYIATDTPDATRALVGHARAREALVALAERDCVVDVRPGELVVVHEHALGGESERESALALALAAHLLPER